MESGDVWISKDHGRMTIEKWSSSDKSSQDWYGIRLPDGKLYDIYFQTEASLEKELPGWWADPKPKPVVDTVTPEPNRLDKAVATLSAQMTDMSKLIAELQAQIHKKDSTIVEQSRRLQSLERYTKSVQEEIYTAIDGTTARYRQNFLTRIVAEDAERDRKHPPRKDSWSGY